MNRRSELFETVQAIDLPGLLLRGRQSWQEERSKDGEDGDDDQELNQIERGRTLSIGCAEGTGWLAGEHDDRNQLRRMPFHTRVTCKSRSTKTLEAWSVLEMLRGAE